MTSYDQIWTTFLNNCKVSDIDLPQTNEGKYEMIKNALSHFNNRMRENITADDSTELLSVDLDNDSMLILAHFIRYHFLINEKTFFQTLFQPFEKDIGLKNFGSQLRSLESSVSEEEKTIDKIIMYSQDDYL